MTDFKQDIDQQTARNAYYWTSFNPERRGDQFISDYIETLEELKLFIEDSAKDEKQQAVKNEVFESLRQKYKSLSLALLATRSRCASSAITGGSGFNVARAEKRNNIEHNKSGEYYEFQENLKKYALKKLNAVYSKAEKSQSELDKKRLELASMEKSQITMKKINVEIRKGSLTYDILKNTYNIDGKLAIELMQGDFMGRKGFATYQLTNNLANIKRVKSRIKDLETMQEKRAGDNTKSIFKGLGIVQNYEEERLQLLFEDKPDEGTRKILKSNGFRWSPRFSAWQRKLTANAIRSLKRYVLPTEEFQQYKPA